MSRSKERMYSMAEENYSIDNKKDYIQISFKKGIEVQPELLLEIIDDENALYVMKDWYCLWDFRGCLASKDFGYDAINRIINYVETQDDIVWSPKMAFVVDATIQYGLLRIFQTLIDGYPTEVAIFNDDAAADAWLGNMESAVSEFTV